MGDVTGTDARIAMLVSRDGSPVGPDDSIGRVFVTGGPDTLEALTDWSNLYEDDGGMSSLNPHVGLDPRVQIHITWHGASLSGNIWNSVDHFQFSATEAATDDVAGVYEGTAACGRAIVILASGSTEAAPEGGGACSEAGSTRLLTVDTPLNRDADGAIHAVLESDKSDVVVKRATLNEAQ